ncbi:MAG TPA: SHOCT domain-containing protein [Nocardioides sp.]|uniref:SHOCT domain-containing protein n=1 Tax=Nocardioides sp. TaxID=35761 RepID=UPI002C7BACCB|nr:SHOCT domain-containing protein [Nocardioides sp.]HQR26000.1 SHOCT domain-containing protein [Nocardioides sp.]
MNSFWDFFWFMVISFFFIAYLMVMFQIVVDIFRDRESSGWVKAAWLVGLIFFPVIVAIVYLVARGQSMAERQYAAAQSAQQSSEDYIRSVAAAGGGSASDEIARAKQLLDSGAISEAEFAQLKAKALGS